MIEINKIERALLGTKKTIRTVCRELDLDIPNADEMLVIQCTHCDTWNKNYNVLEDLDGNDICKYCADLVGL